MAAATATMPGMAKKKSDKADKAQGRSPSYTVFARIAPELGEALDKYLASIRPKPTTTAVVETALEDFLAKAGFWKPPEQAEEQA
jgi:hypothetical protein